MASALEDTTTHVVLTDDGEYFDEDPTFGRGVPRDPAGTADWGPLQPAAVTPQLLAAVEGSMPPPAVDAGKAK